VVERFGASDPRLGRLRFHTQTAGSTLTAQQPEVNLVRTAYEALAAALGGTQSLHTNSMDEALGLPTTHAATLALRTQQVLAHESGVGDTVDPLAGSYYVESLTDRIEEGAREYIEKIYGIGGAVKAIEQGFQQREIADAAYAWQQQVESGDRVVVGVNRFQSAEADEARGEILRVSDELRQRQCEKTRRVRAERDAGAAARATARVAECARGGENLMPAILEAVEAYATVGEIADALRAVFGTHRETFRL
jgi:methylmalonyl-CoA mutase N-terminal domain/subunit